MSQTPQPKIVQKLLLRTAGLLVLAAIAFLVIQKLPGYLASDSSPADTSQQILALRITANGSQAVLVRQDGTVLESPEFSAGTDDREAVWRPDGNRVFISRSVKSGDPELSNYQLYRWNPSNGKLERRTIGTRALAHPRFSPADQVASDAKALVTAGGKVLLFDPLRDGSTAQLLPPSSKEVRLDSKGGDEDSGGGEFEAFYRNIGNSFREAKWVADKSAVVAVMRRDLGEALVVQKLEGTIEERQPRLVAIGDRIEFDVSPKSDKIVYTILNFQWPAKDQIPPEFIKDGKIKRPFFHGAFVLDLATNETKPLDVSQTDQSAFTSVSVSPDGEYAAIVAGVFMPGSDFKPMALVRYSLTGAEKPGVLAQGAVSDPSWHPDGKRLLFTRRVSDSSQPILELSIDTGVERVVSPSQGSFAKPVYSPQLKSTS